MIELFLFDVISIFGDSDSDPTAILLAAGPLAGVTFFVMVYRYYRNVDKRYQFEHSAKTKSAVTQASDKFIREIKRSRESDTQGRNDGAPTWRIGDEMPHELKGNSFLRFIKK